MFPCQLQRLIGKCAASNSKLILALDSNAHSFLWGDDTNARGEAIEDLIATHGLEVANRGYKPTFIGRGTATHIDITITLNCGVGEWRVTDKATLSDLNLIRYNLMLEVAEPQLVPNLQKADWELFRETTEELTDTPDIITAQWLDMEAASLLGLIDKGLVDACPMIKITNKIKKQKFWTPDLQTCKKEVKHARKQALLQQTQESWDSWAEKRKHFRRQLRQAKKASWEKFVQTSESPKDLAKLFKIIQNKSNARLDLLGEDEDPDDTLTTLMSTHFPGCDMENVPTRTIPAPRIRLEFLDEVKFITEDRVLWGIQSFKPHKAAGPDGIKPIVLQQCGPKLLTRLTNFYQCSVILGYVPPSLCESKVIFIPKPGKDNYSKPKSFRPISLTSTIFKVLERVLLNELELTTLMTNPINPRQHAFRKGSSCDSALSDMVDNIEKSILRGEYAVGLFLDISGAFDNVKLSTAKSAMERALIPPRIREWYQDYLFHRTATAEFRGRKVTAILKKGIPQGGVLSPIIWNISFDDFLNLFRTGPVRALGYADDGSLVVCGPDPHTLISLLQKALNKALNWGTRAGLTFSLEKTVAVVFTHKLSGSNGFPPAAHVWTTTAIFRHGQISRGNLRLKTHIQTSCKTPMQKGHQTLNGCERDLE